MKKPFHDVTRPIIRCLFSTEKYRHSVCFLFSFCLLDAVMYLYFVLVLILLKYVQDVIFVIKNVLIYSCLSKIINVSCCTIFDTK